MLHWNVVLIINWIELITYFSEIFGEVQRTLHRELLHRANPKKPYQHDVNTRFQKKLTSCIVVQVNTVLD